MSSFGARLDHLTSHRGNLRALLIIALLILPSSALRPQPQMLTIAAGPHTSNRSLILSPRQTLLLHYCMSRLHLLFAPAHHFLSQVHEGTETYEDGWRGTSSDNFRLPYSQSQLQQATSVLSCCNTIASLDMTCALSLPIIVSLSLATRAPRCRSEAHAATHLLVA